MKDYNPNKTQLCITPGSTPTSAKTSNEPINVISTARTIKTMRSSLDGIPVVTPNWMETCLKEGNLVAPSGAMCTRTLERKDHDDDDDEDAPTEDFGVAKYAAAIQKNALSSSNHLLSGFSVMLCGALPAKDFKGLLQSAGATIITSTSMVNRHLADISSGESGVDRLVFLCDGATSNQTCGLSDALFKQVKEVAEDPTTKEDAVLCVQSKWLVDSISCATPMKGSHLYEPMAPRTKKMWELTTDASVSTSRDNRKESQLY